jgi:ATP-dependent Clp protease ATP-binding subunit ClpA
MSTIAGTTRALGATRTNDAAATKGADDDGTTTVTREIGSEDAERREKIAGKSIGGTMAMGAIGGLSVGVLGKLQGTSWRRTLITAGAVGAVSGVAALASAAHSYQSAGTTDEDPSIVRTGNGAATGVLTGVTILAPLAGIASFAIGRGRGGAGAAKAAAAAAGGGAAAGGTMLSKYGVDLTELARTGELPRAFGVDDKVDELMAVLGAKTKNNPLIVGPAGTGKSALVEELAHRIAAGDVPEHLKGAKLVRIDLDAMVGGSRYRGMFEERLSGVLNEIDASNGKVIPFIDETHKLVNAGAANGVEGAGEAVKPLLARGRIRLIGATTDAKDEIGQIHADPALARRFTEISIQPPDSRQTLNIVRGAATRYEPKGLQFTDDALRSVVELTDPIVGRNQPDKALTLMDTAASRVNIARDARPPRLKELDSALAEARLELGIVGRETDTASVARAKELQARIDQLQPEAESITAGWKQARQVRDELQAARAAVAKPEEGADIAALQARVTELEGAAAEQAGAFPEMYATRITRGDIEATPLPASAAAQVAASRSAAHAVQGTEAAEPGGLRRALGSLLGR